MNIPENVKIAYEQVLCTITQAITWSQKGNVPETVIAVENLTERIASLKLRFAGLARSGDLDTLLAEKDTKPSARTDIVHKYIENPGAILAEAYLISAENALKSGDLATARDSYSKITQDQPLRDFLDDPIDGDESIVYRAQVLDMDPLFTIETVEN